MDAMNISIEAINEVIKPLLGHAAWNVNLGIGSVDELTDILNGYGWEVVGDWSSDELKIIWDVAKDISNYISELTGKMEMSGS